MKDIKNNGRLLGTISSNIRNYEKGYYPAGPIYALNRYKTFQMIKYLRKNNKWNTKDLDEHNYELEIDLLLFDLKLLSFEIYSDNFIYFFDLVNVDTYSDLNYYKDFPLEYQIGLTAISKTTNENIFIMVLGAYTNRLICEKYQDLIKDQKEIIIDKNNYNLFFDREKISHLFNFDFSKFHYFISKIEESDYFIYKSEISDGIEDCGFVPFHFILS